MFRFLSDFVLRYRLNKNLKQLAGVSKERFTHFKNIIILIPLIFSMHVHVDV